MEGILCELMQFSMSNNLEGNVIEINKNKDINYYETLCKYCADNDIDLTNVSDEEFEGCSIIMKEYGNTVNYWNKIYYFSIVQ